MIEIKSYLMHSMSEMLYQLDYLQSELLSNTTDIKLTSNLHFFRVFYVDFDIAKRHQINVKTNPF